MDTVAFVKNLGWPGIGRVYKIRVSALGAICVSRWALLADGRFAGDVLPDWFTEMNDPTTITARYWTHDGVEYLDAAHTMPSGTNNFTLPL